MTVFSERNLSELSHERFEDARAVHGAGRYVVVFSGRPGRARVYDAERRSVLGRPVDVGGASIPESKGTTWVEGDWAFLGAGDGGVKVISMTGDGAVVNGKGIPMPRVVNVAEALSTTNAVASDGSGFLYAASGETGVHVYSSNHRELKPGTSASEPTIEPLGRLDFGSKISANFVAANRERIIVASGLGGLKIVRIQ